VLDRGTLVAAGRALAAVALCLAALAPSAHAAPRDGQAPLFAYYYIWFQPSSWERAKTDYPALGRYSSDETAIMRQHIRAAKAAGIDGFTVSWKSTQSLNERLEKLIDVAQQEHFKLAIIYQGLDFERRPQPVDQIQADMNLFQRRFADREPFKGVWEKPLVIWSGTWEFSRSEIQSVTTPHRDKLLMLASEKNVDGYLRLRGLVDGDAYYWSSVDPDTYPDYEGKLGAMSDLVHQHAGLWIPPAAPGFDARLLGGTEVVDRKDGATLVHQFQAAAGAKPDAIGVISWNEFSENSYIEPSRKFGSRYLDVLRGLLLGPDAAQAGDGFDSSAPGDRGSGGGQFFAIGAVLVVCAIGAGAVVVGRRRRRVSAPPP
jgi:hypothetical protein